MSATQNTVVQGILNVASALSPDELFEWFKRIAPVLLEREKLQIRDAWLAGNSHGWFDTHEDALKSTERYYNETYNNE